jgi:hypothetical protein
VQEKTGRTLMVPFHSDIRPLVNELLEGKVSDDYVLHHFDDLKTKTAGATPGSSPIVPKSLVLWGPVSAQSARQNGRASAPWHPGLETS